MHWKLTRYLSWQTIIMHMAFHESDTRSYLYNRVELCHLLWNIKNTRNLSWKAGMWNRLLRVKRVKKILQCETFSIDDTEKYWKARDSYAGGRGPHHFYRTSLLLKGTPCFTKKPISVPESRLAFLLPHPICNDVVTSKGWALTWVTYTHIHLSPLGYHARLRNNFTSTNDSTIKKPTHFGTNFMLNSHSAALLSSVVSRTSGIVHVHD